MSLNASRRRKMRSLGAAVVAGAALGASALAEARNRKWKQAHPGIAARKARVVALEDVESKNVAANMQPFVIPKGNVHTVKGYGDGSCSTYIFEEIETKLEYIPYLGEKRSFTPEFPVSGFKVVQ